MPDALWPLVAAVFSGAIVGFLLSVFGGGGSVLAAPLLLYLVGVRDPHVAIGTSAAAVSVNALAGLVVHARAGRVKWPCALVFGGAGLAGALLGSTLAKLISGESLLLLFSLAMAAVGASMLRGRRDTGDPDVRLNRRLVLKLAPLGLLTGFAAGFFGIGGGFLIAPGLMAATGMTLSHAAASSLVSVGLFGAGASANFALSGLVDWRLFALLVVGGALGIVAGAPASRALAGRAGLARRLFALLILGVAGYVALQAAAP